MTQPGRLLRDAAQIAPSDGTWRAVIRVAVSVGVPLLVCWATGHIELGLYATFGAFTSLYGRFEGYVERIVMQIQAAVTLVAAMLAGTTLSVLGAPIWVRVVAIAVMATIGAALAGRLGWHPPGALFVVFAGGATASIPSGASAYAHLAIAGGGAALFSLLVTTVLAALRGGLRERYQPADPMSAKRAINQAWLSGATALAGGSLTAALGHGRWYWGAVAGVAVAGGSHVEIRLRRGLQRFVGTLGGVVVAAFLLWLHPSPLVAILIAIACQVGAELFVARNYAIAMLFVTPLALLMVELAAPTDPRSLLTERALDTALGVLAAAVVVVIYDRRQQA
ncbi:fusaric acid resistance family protein [Branchiibius hedensis]|uniref:Fusaric acid resistance protein-like n=1 Tax=Branchiibius hedensis TaxID=672460 RepID=A0A2Y8ZNC6_9MICO|nr:FUSC family protein [Branchiibius hedensis]PWJ25005.1 fusaric acid resistance family protein [Branchiibius hedensis]SSA33820.1 Fusaric acid resistance protein-like [Branchiibius hedensis]